MKISTFLKEFRAVFIKIPAVLNLLAIIMSFTYLGFRVRELPPQIPLWHTLPWGNTQLSSPVFLWLIPASLTLFFIINIFLEIFVFNKSDFLAKLLCWQGVLVSFLGLLTLWRVIVISMP